MSIPFQVDVLSKQCLNIYSLITYKNSGKQNVSIFVQTYARKPETFI